MMHVPQQTGPYRPVRTIGPAAGSLGDGATGALSLPVKVTGMTSASQVSAGWNSASLSTCRSQSRRNSQRQGRTGPLAMTFLPRATGGLREAVMKSGCFKAIIAAVGVLAVMSAGWAAPADAAGTAMQSGDGAGAVRFRIQPGW